MTEKIRASDVEAFLDVLGLDELPMGMYYSDGEPEEGITPKSGSTHHRNGGSRRSRLGSAFG